MAERGRGKVIRGKPVRVVASAVSAAAAITVGLLVGPTAAGSRDFPTLTDWIVRNGPKAGDILVAEDGVVSNPYNLNYGRIELPDEDCPTTYFDGSIGKRKSPASTTPENCWRVFPESDASPLLVYMVSAISFENRASHGDQAGPILSDLERAEEGLSSAKYALKEAVAMGQITAEDSDAEAKLIADAHRLDEEASEDARGDSLERAGEDVEQALGLKHEFVAGLPDAATTKPQTTTMVTLMCPATVVVGGTILISGTGPAGASITITYSTPASSATTTHTVTTDSSGNYSFTITAPTAGTYGFQGNYDGSSSTQCTTTAK